MIADEFFNKSFNRKYNKANLDIYQMKKLVLS